MTIKIITIGKKSSQQYSDLIDDYCNRLANTQKIEWEYLNSNPLGLDKARNVESADVLVKLKPNDVVWLLDERGEQISSPALAGKLSVLKNQSVQRLVIVIGGSYGVNDQLRDRANWIWALSTLVFPHQLVRLVLTEQLYRAYEIERGSGYHHA